MVRLPATMGLGTGLILLFGGSGEDEKQVRVLLCLYVALCLLAGMCLSVALCLFVGAGMCPSVGRRVSACLWVCACLWGLFGGMPEVSLRKPPGI